MTEGLKLIRGARIQAQIDEIEYKNDNSRILSESMGLPDTFVEGRNDINELIAECYRLDEGILDKGIAGFGKMKVFANKAMQKLKDSQPVSNFAGRASKILAKYKEKFGDKHPASQAAEEIAQHAAQNPERSAFVTTMLNGLVSMFGRPDAEEAVTKALGNTKDAIEQDIEVDKDDEEEREVAKTQGDPETDIGGVSSGNTKYPTLRNNIEQMNTKKRQHATDPVQMKSHSLVVSVPSGVLEVKASIVSDSKKYDTVVQFSNVKYQDEDTGTNQTITASDGNEYNILPITLKEKNVKVRCNCLDFYHRFAQYNAKDGSLQGDPIPPHVPTTDRASDNPKKLPGVCKHVIKTVLSLKQSGIVT